MFVLLVGVLSTALSLLFFSCTRKKQRVEDLMAKPHFSEPVRVNNQASLKNSNRRTNKENPRVEHTISIKLDNNADEDDLKGPRESLSRDPVTDIPPEVKTKRNRLQPSSNDNPKTDPDRQEMKTKSTDKDAFNKPVNGNSKEAGKSVEKASGTKRSVKTNAKNKKEAFDVEPTQDMLAEGPTVKPTLEEEGGNKMSHKSARKKLKGGKVEPSKRFSVLSIKSARPLLGRPTRPMQSGSVNNKKEDGSNELEPTQELSIR